MASVHGAGGGTLFPSSSNEAVAGSNAPGSSGPLGLASATSGFDTVSGTGSSGFAGGAGSEQVVATQTQDGGNTVVHLDDGSTITVVGVTHFDASFFH